MSTELVRYDAIGALTRHRNALRQETVERFGPRKGRAA